MSAASVHRYVAFGLRLRSAIELPELDVLSDDGEACDVDIEHRIDPSLDGEVGFLAATDPMHHVSVSDRDIGIDVFGGRSIVVRESDPLRRPFTRAVLLGPAFASLLYQRSAWVMHAGAVEIDGGVWLFGGASGAGKSTLVSWLHRHRSFNALSDDIGAVFPADGAWRFAPGPRTVRVLDDSHRHVYERATAAEERDREGKVHVRLPAAGVARDWPIRGLVMLAAGAVPTAVRLRGFEAYEAVRTSIYRPWGGLSIRSASDTSRYCAGFLDAVPVYRYERPHDFAGFADALRPLDTLFGR